VVKRFNGPPGFDGEYVRAADYDAAIAALRRCNIDCGELHHEKRDYHESGECPVALRINAILDSQSDAKAAT
jgi:hypothetical protein